MLQFSMANTRASKIMICRTGQRLARVRRWRNCMFSVELRRRLEEDHPQLFIKMYKLITETPAEPVQPRCAGEAADTDHGPVEEVL